MSSISDAKVLGGIGSLLVLLTAVPNVGWLLGIAGFVMILLAIRNISRTVGDKKIYDNMVKAVVLAVGAIGVGTVTVALTIYRVLSFGGFVGPRFVLASHIPASEWFGLIATVVAGLVAVWAILVGSAIFVRRSYNGIASKLNVGMFEKAGLLFLIGAATTIIGIGFLIIVVAEILLAVSFFSIQEEQKMPQSGKVQTVSATS